jgi:predicted neuraminidase
VHFEIIRKGHVFEPGKHFPQCHASTVLLLGEDVVCAWFGGTRESHPDVAIWASRMSGGTWGDPVKIADEEGVPCWNPVLMADGRRVLLFFKAGPNPRTWRTLRSVSADEGRTWSHPAELVPGDVGGRGPVKNKAIVLSDGTWLAPASLETETRWDAFTDRSRDHGETWSRSAMVPVDHGSLRGKGIIQPTLWESSPGTVHMLLRSTEGSIYRSDSVDSGETWCPAYATGLPNNNSGIDLVRMADGRLVLVFNPVGSNWGMRTPIVCSVSADNGKTWGESFTLDHEENPKDRSDGEFSYPAIVSRDGRVLIAYTWRRRTVEFYELAVR